MYLRTSWPDLQFIELSFCAILYVMMQLTMQLVGFVSREMVVFQVQMGRL